MVNTSRVFCLLTAGLVAISSFAWLQQDLLAQQAPRQLEHKDYDLWNSVSGQTISNDGKWIAYSIVQAKGKRTLKIREVGSQKEFVIAGGSGARFTFDNQFAVYSILPDPELIKKLQKEKKKPDELPKPKLEFLNLETGKHTTIENASSASMPAKAAGWVAYSLNKPKKQATVQKTNSSTSTHLKVTPEGLKKSTPPKPKAKPKAKPGTKPQAKGKAAAKKEKPKSTGSTLVLRNLATGVETHYPNVSSRAFSEDGARLAISVSSEVADEDGVYVVQLSNLTRRQIISGRGNYRSLRFSKKGNQLVFMSDREDYNSVRPSMSIYHWQDSQKSATKIVDAKSEGIPKDWWVASAGASFSEDGTRIQFATQPKHDDAGKTKEQLDKEKKAKAGAEPKAKLDLWHWKDPVLQPQQLLQAARERNRSYLAVYHIASKKVVQLADPSVKIVSVDPRSKSNVAVGLDMEKYSMLRSWDSPGFTDTYLVNIATGEKRLVLNKVRGIGSLSPNGKYLSWWDADKKKYFALDTASANAKPVDLTRGIKTSLANELHDTPSAAGSYGNAGWLDGDKALLLYDRFDIWQVDPTGKVAAKCLTGGQGRKNKIRYRALRLDSEQRTINPANSITLSAFNEQNKSSGFCTLGVDGKITTHLMLDESVSGLRKAKNSDVVMFSRQTFRNCPDIWASTMAFQNVSRISDSNPQQKNYKWGSAELVGYKSADGTDLQGILLKPDGFDPKKKYPMMVYFYERNSDNLHRYWAPAAGRSIINFSFYVSRGYVIFIPDIPYKAGYPGKSAYNAVIPGVKQVVSKGFVDEKKIGVQGHSWGGYQIAYLVTQTDIFACAESGAPVSNMTSAYGGIRWGSGMSRMFQYERTQSRIGQTLWQARGLYLENSPIFYADKINTPLLILHNDQDGAVPWYQGIELFVAMRRLGKPAWMLNYNGEPHWVMKPENRMDFVKRMQQFFDHYLMDAPAPKWLVEGIPAVDKGKKFGFEPASNPKQNPESNKSK